MERNDWTEEPSGPLPPHSLSNYQQQQGQGQRRSSDELSSSRRTSPTDPANPTYSTSPATQLPDSFDNFVNDPPNLNNANIDDPTQTEFHPPATMRGTNISRLMTPSTSPTIRDFHIGAHSRNTSTQFLLAHARSRDSEKTAALPEHEALKRQVSEYESIERQLRGRTFLGGLVKPAVVRQFLHRDHLFKEAEERGVSHFELFADLVFVAIVNILGEVAAEEATLFNAVKFVLVFWPPWSIWADMRSYLNVSGTDDILQRAYILITSCLLIGYTAQSASIEVDFHGGGSESIIESMEENEIEVSHISRRFMHMLFKRGESDGVVESTGTAIISEQGYAALRAATAFFLAAKAIRIFILVSYAFALPRFRTAHLAQAFFTLLPCLVFLRMFFVNEVVDAMVVFIVGVTLEITGKYVAGVVVHMGSTRKAKHQFFIPALEIGHVIEKTTAFFVLVAGEIVMAAAYVATEADEIGAHGEFGRSCLGVTLAFLLCWLYFDADCCKVFVHALRRHWFSSITWTQLHLPLCASLVIVGSAAHEMIISKELEQGIRWYFGIGMAVILICISSLGFLHCSLDKPGSSLIPRRVRLSLRVVMAGFFCAFPLFKNESSVLELGVYSTGLGALVVVETIGKIGTVGNVAPHLPVPVSGSASVQDSVSSPRQGIESYAMAPQAELSEGQLHRLSVPHDQHHFHYRHGIYGHGQDHDARVEHASGVEYFFGHKRYRRDDLTAYEKGEEDIGGDDSVGIMKAVSVRRGQRTGFAAF